MNAENNLSQSVPPEDRKPLMSVWCEILLYLLACFVFMVSLGGLFALVDVSTQLSTSVCLKILGYFVNAFLMLVASAVPAFVFTKFVALRPLSDLGLSIKGRTKDILLGLLLAMVIYAVGFGILYVLGSVRIEAIHADWGMLAAIFTLYFVAASTEEIMVRGYILSRLMAAHLNKFAALALSSFLFSLMHIFNPNVALFPLINLFLAGMMLGAAFLYTHNLWFPISLHVFWNWIQGSVLGFPVSGSEMFPSLLTLSTSGDAITSGGSFGFEGSIVCTALMVASTLGIIWWGERRKRAN